MTLIFEWLPSAPTPHGDGDLHGPEPSFKSQDAELGLELEPGRQGRRLLDELPRHGPVAGQQVGEPRVEQAVQRGEQ